MLNPSVSRRPTRAVFSQRVRNSTVPLCSCQAWPRAMQRIRCPVPVLVVASARISNRMASPCNLKHCCDHMLDVGIAHTRKNGQAQYPFIRGFGHGTETGPGAKTVAIERMQVHRNIVHVGADAALSQRPEDLSAVSGDTNHI